MNPRWTWFFVSAALCFLTMPSFASSKRVYFRTASAIPQPESAQGFDEAAKEATDSDGCIELRGFYELREKSDYYNLLGRGRLLVSFKELTDRGVKPSRIVFKSAGTTSEDGEYRSSTKTNVVEINARPMGSFRDCKTTSPSAPDSSSVHSPDLILSFEPGRAEHAPVDPKAVSAFWATGAKDESRKIIIEGHADSSGPSAYNLLLSKVRALKVYQTLVYAGIPGHRIELKYYGQTMPSDSSRSKDAFRKNRRVSVVWAAKSDTTGDGQAPVTASKADEPIVDDYVPTQWQPVLLGGYVMPPKSVKDDVKNTIIYGAGLNYVTGDLTPLTDAFEVRMTSQNHKAKSSGIAGHLSMLSLKLGGMRQTGDGLLGLAFHYGVAAYRWKGTAEQSSTKQKNEDSATATGLYINIGRPFWFGKRFSVEPLLQSDYVFSGPKGFAFGFITELGWRI